MGKKKKNKDVDLEKYRNWFSHLENTKERTNYSIRRMDLLTISITGAGIYIIFETLKFLKEENIIVYNSWLLVASGICFLLSVCTNFSSQITGFYANHFEEKYILLVLEQIKKKKVNLQDMDRFDCKTLSFNKWTRVLNILSVSTMFLGLIGLVVFYFNFFP